MKKIVEINPPQLLEAFISNNNWDKTPEIIMTVRKFQEMVKDLETQFDFDFGYNDLINFSSRFSVNNMIIIEEMEIHLHKSALKMLSHLQWYNNMYNQISGLDRILSSWKKIQDK